MGLRKNGQGWLTHMFHQEIQHSTVRCSICIVWRQKVIGRKNSLPLEALVLLVYKDHSWLVICS